MRLACAGGGTAGHVYPALAVIQTLAAARESEKVEILFVGSKHGMEAQLVAHYKLPFAGISAGGLIGTGPRQAAQHALSLAKGVMESWNLLRRFRPHVLLATGGYASAPVIMAAWLQRIPSLIYLPDITPGLAVRALAPLADRIAVTASVTAQSFGRKGVVTGYPVRPALYQTSRAEARRKLGVIPDLPLLLVFGGSRGAHSINVAIGENLETLTEQAQILHICGTADLPQMKEAQEMLPAGHRNRYRVVPYLHEGMPWAFVAADLAISRAGASVLGELPAAGLPAILVPYPYAARHQEQNARYLASAGAAVMIADNDLATELPPVIDELLRNAQKREEMREKMRSLDRPDAGATIAQLLHDLAKD